MAATSPARECACGEPLFFKTYNAKRNEMPDLAPLIQRRLLLSLVLAHNDIPQSKYKVKVGKNSRKMVATYVAEKNKMSLKRTDQPDIEYEIEWVSQEVKDRWWGTVRSAFQEKCEKRPTEVESIQRRMLKVLLSSSQLFGGFEKEIKDYCYSGDAWMDGQGCRKDDRFFACEQLPKPDAAVWENDLEEDHAMKLGKCAQSALASSSAAVGSQKNARTSLKGKQLWSDIVEDDESD